MTCKQETTAVERGGARFHALHLRCFHPCARHRGGARDRVAQTVGGGKKLEEKKSRSASCQFFF